MEDSFDNHGLGTRHQGGRDDYELYSDSTCSIPASYLAIHCPTDTRGWQSPSVPNSGSASIPSLLNSSTGNCSHQRPFFSSLPTPMSKCSEKMTHDTLSLAPVPTVMPAERSASLGNCLLKLHSPQALSEHHPNNRYVQGPDINIIPMQRTSSSSGGHRSSTKTIHASKQASVPRSNTKKNGGRGKEHQASVETPVASLPISTGAESVQPTYRQISWSEGRSESDNEDGDAFNEIGKMEEIIEMQTTTECSRSQVGAAPAVQRERNRVAATKCRAKTKAAITKLEEVERAVSDRREYLSAERSALINEVLSLRLELIRHSNCQTDSNIDNYLRNAAIMIGQTGGTHRIWGPDGSGKLWPMDHSRT